MSQIVREAGEDVLDRIRCRNLRRAEVSRASRHGLRHRSSRRNRATAGRSDLVETLVHSLGRTVRRSVGAADLHGVADGAPARDRRAVGRRRRRGVRRLPIACHPPARRALPPARAGAGAGAGRGRACGRRSRVSGHRKLRRAAGAVGRANRPLAERFCNVFDHGRAARGSSPPRRARESGPPREEDLFAACSTRKRFPDFLSRVLYADTKSYLTNDILVKVDRASMANSLEVRAPLVDHHVLEFAAAHPVAISSCATVCRNTSSRRRWRRSCRARSSIARSTASAYRSPRGSAPNCAACCTTSCWRATTAPTRFFDRAFVERMLREHAAGKPRLERPTVAVARVPEVVAALEAVNRRRVRGAARVRCARAASTPRAGERRRAPS